MSLAASSVLRAPLIEYFYGDELEVTVWSEAQQHSTGVRLVHFLAQEAIFQAAIRSFFKPPIKVKQLFFAIEWFAMEATYNEIRLVGAMTALENLIDFKPRPRRSLRSCLGPSSTKSAGCCSLLSGPVSANGHPKGQMTHPSKSMKNFLILNRRSLLRNSNCWRPAGTSLLDGISPESMRAAKQARDKVVHRGQYYEDAKEKPMPIYGLISRSSAKSPFGFSSRLSAMRAGTFRMSVAITMQHFLPLKRLETLLHTRRQRPAIQRSGSASSHRLRSVPRSQSAVQPPSTTSDDPVISADASLARNTTAPIRSSTVPRRPSFILDSTLSRNAAFSKKRLRQRRFDEGRARAC